MGSANSRLFLQLFLCLQMYILINIKIIISTLNIFCKDLYIYIFICVGTKYDNYCHIHLNIITIVFILCLFFPFLFLFELLCHLFFNVLKVHICMCLNRLDSPVKLKLLSNAVMSFLIYIFLILFCCSFNFLFCTLSFLFSFLLH